MAAEYEIVERLRGCQSEEDDRAHQDGIIPSEIFGEAAATIVALAEALEPFAEAWRVANRHKAPMTLAEFGALAMHHCSSVNFRKAHTELARLKGDSA